MLEQMKGNYLFPEEIEGKELFTAVKKEQMFQLAEEYSGETFYYAADNVRVKNMMDGIEMSVSAENEEAYRSMILEAVQKQTEEQSTGMSQQM